MKRSGMAWLVAFAFLSSGAQAQRKKRSKKELAQIISEHPLARDIIYGKKISQITSCAAIDSVPWKFLPDGRQTRVLIRDTMRLNENYEAWSWEISQVMDGDGFSTFVFRRAVKKGEVLAYAIKDYLYNEILETATGPQVVASKDVKHLINKPAFTFTSADGGSVVYYPGAFKSGYLSISQSGGISGRDSSAVYIRSMICYRDDEALESLKIGKEKEEAKDAASKAAASAVKK